MKVTLNWLKQYVTFDWSPDELKERLTLLGLEVEGDEKLGGEFEQIVVAEVLTRDPHPNADRLSLCRVFDGRGERQIVCGAQNFKAGDKVPLALPGAVMPTTVGQPPFIIKVGKIRGSESQGMMCSAKELGLSDDAEGLFLLPPDAKVGQPFAEHVGRSGSDVVYDLEITPNRPDLNSVIGIAREISALTGNPLRLPEIPDNPHSTTPSANDLVSIRIDAPELCPRYTARVVLGVKIGPSPAWLRRTIEKVGLRSINNVVDVTNYVMLECGQPLHAFDYHRIAKGPDGKPTIIVRAAQDREGFQTLDGKQHQLSSSMLLISDPEKAVALAGIMGGQNTEITEQSQDLLLESAYFKPQGIRSTSKGLALKSDSSYRFERGADIDICDWASQRAVQLILETAGGQVALGRIDVFPQPPPQRQITLRHGTVKAVLGIEVDPKEVTRLLRGLGIEESETSADRTTYRAPSFRVDLKREHDLIEEIGRLYGIDRIPSTPPRGGIGFHPFDAIHDQLAETRRILTGLGLDEAQGQTLISDSSAKLMAAENSLVSLSYPLSADMNTLRPSLLPGLLDSMRRNISHQIHEVALFEIGRVFSQVNGEVREERRLGLAMTGRRTAPFWSGNDREARRDIYDIKGAVDELLNHLGIRGTAISKPNEGGSFYLEATTVQLGKQTLGEFGQISPLLAKQYDLRDPVLLAEFNLDLLMARRSPTKSFKLLPNFPSVRRDVAMIVPNSTTHDAVMRAVRQAKPTHLETMEIFDVFRGQNVPEGQKSVAYAFIYRAPDRTLTDTEVNATHEKLVSQFQTVLNANVRSQ